ncbi:MAG: sigma-70 family RNA polymerase sigma factor [Gemmataceae bacterium]
MQHVDEDAPDIVELPEGSPEDFLLDRFVEDRSEAAFAALVRRHGPLVFSLCQRILQHQQDAEDAFQATFLVLARKAGTISHRACVGSWLYSVAYRIAQQAKAKRARLPVHDPNPADIPAADQTAELLWRDLRPILDDEVNRLPPKYRVPFVLCYFEGKTNEQAAAQMGCPVGTILSRLSRARDRLRTRLKRRGVALSVSLLLLLITERARALSPSPVLTQATVRAGLLFSGAKAFAANAIARNVVALADGYLKGLRRHRWMRTLAGLLAGSCGLGALALLFVALWPVPDQERIQGTWRATRMEFGGQEYRDNGTLITFTGDDFDLDCHIAGALGHFEVKAKFRLDPTTSPKSVNFTDPGGNIWLGIYEFDGDSLKICFNLMGPRPTSFVTQPNSQMMLYETRRKK